VTQVAKPADAAAPPAAPAAAVAAPVTPPPPASAEADKAKEQEALQKAAQEEAARQEAAAREAAAKDALARQTAANDARDRIKKIVARAKAKCEIPSAELSENENLVYENAMAVPGATRQRDGSVRLPEVTLGDGTTARFVIDSESCAHRVN
jgi:colicin import membrane protein